MVEDVIMRGEMWKDLPFELHAYILQFCSVPVLCRFRVVCCTWNNQIQELDFALKVQPQDTYIITTPNFIINWLVEIKNLLRYSLDLFDPSIQKFYLINIEFLCDSMQNEPNLLDPCQILATARGFVWVLWSKYSGLMHVINPVTRSVVEIPPISPMSASVTHMVGAMVVAENYSSFTLYVHFSIGASSKPRLAYLDSQVSKWREFSPLSKRLEPCDMLEFKEMLYVLFRDWGMFTKVYKIFAFNKRSGAWINMGLELPNDVDMPRLATTLGRLLFVGVVHYFSKEENRISIEALEINIASKKCSIVTIMEKACYKDLFKSFGTSTENLSIQRMGVSIGVVGCGNFIVLTSIRTNKFIAYDLLNDDWSEWSFCRSNVKVNHHDGMPYGISARAMTLTFKPVPQLQQ